MLQHSSLAYASCTAAHCMLLQCYASAQTGASQVSHACYELASHDLGCVVEACDSAVPLLVAWLRDWADKGTLVLQHTAFISS